jgi:DNA polymerase-1
MLIIDGTYLVYKSYYRGDKIRKTNGIDNFDHFKKIVRNMFLKSLFRLKNTYKPTSLFIVFDAEGGNFRNVLLPSYKANRKEKPEGLYEIKLEIYDFLEQHNFTYQISENTEADDLIASYVHQNPNDKVMIYTGDGDLAALVNSNVTLLLEKIKKIRVVTTENFHHFFHVPPKRFAEFKALQGDKSDNIKGVDGLFRTQVLQFFMEFPSLESFFEIGKDHYLFQKINSEREKILVNIAVSTMKLDCEIKINKQHARLSHIYLPETLATKLSW